MGGYCNNFSIIGFKLHMKKRKEVKGNHMTAKLSFFEGGWGDRLLYRIKAKTNEKIKGMLMIDKIKDFFGITNNDQRDFEKNNIKEESERIRWTRDERGNIVSPFQSKKIV